eukprot:7447889-Alexandrium_andersonii.AAC.1
MLPPFGRAAFRVAHPTQHGSMAHACSASANPADPARPGQAKTRHEFWVVRCRRFAAVSYTHLTLPTICSV